MPRLILITTLLYLCACSAQESVTRQSIGFEGSATITTRSTSAAVVQARVIRTNGLDAEYFVQTQVKRTDGQRPDVSAVYAFGTVIPYLKLQIPAPADPFMETGRIPMTQAIVASLAQTGLSVQMRDGDRLHSVLIPANAFSDILRNSP